MTDTGLASQILEQDGCQSEVENNRGQVHPQTMVREFCGTWEGLSLSSGDDLEMASCQQHRAVGRRVNQTVRS